VKKVQILEFSHGLPASNQGHIFENGVYPQQPVDKGKKIEISAPQTGFKSTPTFGKTSLSTG
jgi:hypothetical protein